MMKVQYVPPVQPPLFWLMLVNRYRPDDSQRSASAMSTVPRGRPSGTSAVAIGSPSASSPVSRTTFQRASVSYGMPTTSASLGPAVAAKEGVASHSPSSKL